MEQDHWKYQQVVWFDNLDPETTLRRGVVRTCIYGVRCVASQTEEIKRLLARIVENDHPEVATLLERFCYVDDLGKSTPSTEHSRKLMRLTEEVLAILQMKIKGWGLSGEDPPPELCINHLEQLCDRPRDSLAECQQEVILGTRSRDTNSLRTESDKSLATNESVITSRYLVL